MFKKCLLILMLFLLPLQYSWALAADYDMHNELDTHTHFGHHEHPSFENHHDTADLDITDNLAGDNESDTNTQTTKNHDHFGFIHLSCGEVLSRDLPSFPPESKQFSIQHLFNNDSPPTYQLERPNWLAAV